MLRFQSHIESSGSLLWEPLDEGRAGGNWAGGWTGGVIPKLRPLRKAAIFRFSLTEPKDGDSWVIKHFLLASPQRVACHRFLFGYTLVCSCVLVCTEACLPM